jgi:hypothetical protein
MPRHYFDIDTGKRRVHDDRGLELADGHAARHAALVTLPGLVGEMVPARAQWSVILTIRNESGTPIFRSTLAMTSEWLAVPAGHA